MRLYRERPERAERERQEILRQQERERQKREEAEKRKELVPTITMLCVQIRNIVLRFMRHHKELVIGLVDLYVVCHVITGAEEATRGAST